MASPRWLTDLVPKAAPARKPVKHAVSAFGVDQKTEKVPNIAMLRRWANSNPYVFAAISLRRSQISKAPWTIRYKNVKEKTDQTEKLRQQIIALLSKPNPQGRNNSFRSLWEPVVDDILTLDLGVIEPTRDLKGRIVGLDYLDASWIELVRGWRSEKDGPRYYLKRPGDTGDGIPLSNEQLITISANPKTFCEVGLAPIGVLHETLQADYDIFRRTWMQNARHAPTGIFTAPSVGDDQVREMDHYYKAMIEGTSSVVFVNWPEDTKFIPIGETDLIRQGVQWFTDLMVRRICAAFQVMPMQIGWSRDINRSTAETEGDLAADQGLVPLLLLVQEFVNTEIVSSFGPAAANLEFFFTELAGVDELKQAQVLRTLWGNTPGASWRSYNDQRKNSGEIPYEFPDGDERNYWVNEPLVPIGPNMVAPITVAARIHDPDNPQGNPAMPGGQFPGQPQQQPANQPAKKPAKKPGKKPDAGGAPNEPGASPEEAAANKDFAQVAAWAETELDAVLTNAFTK